MFIALSVVRKSLMIMEGYQDISGNNTLETGATMLTEDTDFTQSHRKKIVEFALRHKIDILFKEDIQMNKTYLSLKWISGDTSIYQYEIQPEVKEDGETIKINPTLRHTIQKGPSL